MLKAWLIGGGALITALLLVSIVLALTEDDETLEEGTPERAVQAFLRAIKDEDYIAAYAFLSREVREGCTVEEFATRNIISDDITRDRRVTLLKTRLLNGSAIVETRITRFEASEPFGASQDSVKQPFTLRLEQGEWRFVNVPWPYFGCEEAIFPPAEAGIAPVRTPATTSTHGAHELPNE